MAGPTLFKTQFVQLARQESEALSGRCRGDQELEIRIESYGRSIGITDIASFQQHYSAVFISWCMRTAGASEAEFPTALSHSKYAQFAVQNADAEQGAFQARRIEAYAPQLGDILHVNRNNGKVTFDRILAGSYFSESGIVIDIVPRKALIVMGNQEPCGNVGTEELALADSGLLIQRGRNPLIAVIEVLK
ncbi:DUF2272 domain-containing protein [Bradyrhizobium sp. SSUT18]|uniref:DUF2272 domain-containing protein n=1 Tax=unclassified Bradyrhizobium TaxID=2631580 RepID=UPI002449F156|nr:MULTISPECIES: DUF2272 domain-containing protein [unclassified Bradyrhizobium]MDH2351558.1 DUF2272 domain-containing protein [Bradyrhizobium sp. SSUT112]MDH2402768.1 DUF2272 domain-containing protein [Bradyrhizobium sp. SSUT18]